MHESSLAVFATPENLRTFRVPNALARIVSASDRFYVKPLLRAVSFPMPVTCWRWRSGAFGAVDMILVDIDQIIPERIDERGAVSFPEQQDEGEYGVVDEIAARVLAAGGRVIGVRKADIPREGMLATTLRYPV